MELITTHTHTCFTNHGVGTVEELVSAAVAAGVSTIAVTEHYPMTATFDPDRYLSMPAERMGEYLAAVEAARCTSVFGRAPRVWGDFPRELDRVVTCTGSAGDLGRACLRAQVDCLVCGEIKYHDALELSQAGLAVVDLGHDTSELPLAAVLAAAVENAGIPGDLVTVLDQGDNWSYPETVRV